MLDGILGRGFTSKCKSLIKLTKSRIDVLRRKKKATLKFLKKDVADLLANGLDINAFGRADGLLAELKISFCYDFVEQSCDSVLQHLPIIQKQRECPEECREAVASLMFAAARFSDLPELRELRQIFQERFDTSLEHFENKKFVENLASKPSTLEEKVRLLQDVALEFSIKWDPVAFEKRMSTPPTFAQGVSEGLGSSNALVEKPTTHIKEMNPRGGKNGASYKESFEHTNGGHRFLKPSDSSISEGKELNFRSRQEFPGNGHEKVYDKEEPVMKIDGYTNHFREKKGSTVCKHDARNGKVDSTFRTDRMGSSSSSEIQGDADDGLFVNNGRQVPFSSYLKFSPHTNPAVVSSAAGLHLKRDVQEPSFGNTHTGRNGYAYPPGKAEEEKHHKLKPSYHLPAPSGAGLQLNIDVKEPAPHDTHNGYANLPGKTEDKHHKSKPGYNSALPPPYVKANSRLKDLKDEGHLDLSCIGSDNSSISTNPQKHVRSETAAGVIQLESHHSDHERQTTSPTNTSSHPEKDHLFGAGIPPDALPKPRSVRRRHHKARSSRPVDDAEDIGVVRRKSRSRRRDDKRGLQLLVDEEENQRDEEELIIDKLLIHYSKKPSSFEPGTMRRKPKIHLTHENSSNATKPPLSQRRESPDEQSDIVPPPPRSVSLPREHGPSEATKVFTRAASFQPDRSNAAKHVHPKLPDYDDLAARFAALRGR